MSRGHHLQPHIGEQHAMGDVRVLKASALTMQRKGRGWRRKYILKSLGFQMMAVALYFNPFVFILRTMYHKSCK